MTGHGAKLPRKRQQAIVALIEHSTMKEAARAIGIGEATIHRWLKNESFLVAYREAKRRVVDHAITCLQKATGEAVRVLQEILSDPDKPPSARVTAARTILDMAVKAVEMDDLTARLEEIERTIEGGRR